MKKWEEDNTFYVIFESITELVKYCKNTENSKSMYSTDSSHSGKDWYGTNNMEEADELALKGWDEGYQKLKDALPELKVKVTATNRKHVERIEVEGFVPCVPRTILGHPENMFNARRIPYKQKIINIVVHVGGTANYGVDDFVQRATFVARLIDELEYKGYRINLYTAKSAYECDSHQYYLFMVKIKSSTENLTLKRIAYPIGHPSIQRRHFFKVLETLAVSSSWNCGYGRTDDSKIKEYIKEHHDAALFIPSLNALRIGNDYQSYMDGVFKFNDFRPE